MQMQTPQVVCFGEVLWDMLLSGKLPGGAPMNVAYHLNQLGINTAMISRVGKDTFGQELMGFLQKKGVSTSYIQTDKTHPTGTVEVTLDPKGSPSYQIMTDVAWDFIELDTKSVEVIHNAKFFVFGSLAFRNINNRKVLSQTIATNDKTHKILDLNLRKPFPAKQDIISLLTFANSLKMNDEELEVVSCWFDLGDEEQKQIAALKERFDLDWVIVTKGAKGSVCIANSRFYTQDASEVQIQDTIGSGDAFLAGFITQFHKGVPIQNCLAYASALGAYVATKAGGMPPIDTEAILALTKVSPLSNL
jgi:fructokinase